MPELAVVQDADRLVRHTAHWGWWCWEGPSTLFVTHMHRAVQHRMPLELLGLLAA